MPANKSDDPLETITIRVPASVKRRYLVAGGAGWRKRVRDYMVATAPKLPHEFIAATDKRRAAGFEEEAL